MTFLERHVLPVAGVSRGSRFGFVFFFPGAFAPALVERIARLAWARSSPGSQGFAV